MPFGSVESKDFTEGMKTSDATILLVWLDIHCENKVHLTYLYSSIKPAFVPRNC